MTTTGFQAWQYATECERLIEAGSLDKELDRVAAAVERRRDALRELKGKIGKGMEHWHVGQAAKRLLARAVTFAVGDLVIVESGQATYRTYGVVGCVTRVNDKTLWIEEAPGVRFPKMPRFDEAAARDWQTSRLTKFQKLKGFKALKEHCAHHTAR